MSKTKMTIYPNGVSMKLKNRRIDLEETENAVLINFRFAEANADIPACRHTCIRGKVRETFIKLSPEAMRMLLYSYLKYDQEKRLNDIANKIVNDEENKLN